MKNLILTVLFATTLMAANTVSAKTADLGFRIGQVMAAEIGSAPQEIINIDRYPYPLPAKRVFAVVVVKMTPNRSLSSLDYSLTVNGITAPCLSLVSNMASFVCDPDVTFPAEKDYIRLLFVLDANRVKVPAAGKTIRGTLKSNLRGRSSVVLNILSVGNKPFSDCTKIPAAGALK